MEHITSLKTMDPADKPRPSEKGRSQADARTDLPDFLSLLLLVPDLTARVETQSQPGSLTDSQDPSGGFGALRQGIGSEPQVRANSPQGRSLPTGGILPQTPEDGMAPEPLDGNDDTGRLHPGMDRNGPLDLRSGMLREMDLPNPSQIPTAAPNESTNSPSPGTALLLEQTSDLPEAEIQPPASASPGLNPRAVMDPLQERILSFIRLGAANGKAEEQVMKILLKPESLGRLELRISMTDNQVNTSIITESAVVMELIDSQKGGLRTALEEHGFQMNDFLVSVGRQSPQDDGQSTPFWTRFSSENERGQRRGEDVVSKALPPWGRFSSDIPGRRVPGLVNIFV